MVKIKVMKINLFTLITLIIGVSLNIDIYRAVRASHVLISAAGRVCLTGMRSACYLIQHGEMRRCVYEFPPQPEKMLLWLSPEILEQVRKTPISLIVCKFWFHGFLFEEFKVKIASSFFHCCPFI